MRLLPATWLQIAIRTAFLIKYLTKITIASFLQFQKDYDEDTLGFQYKQCGSHKTCKDFMKGMTTTKVLCCEGDLCNSSSMATPKFVTLFLAMLFGYILRKL